MDERDTTPAPAPVTTLIDAAALARLAGPGLAVFDCRHDLRRPQWGREAYDAAHIPGAAFASVDADLSGPVTPHSGRHPLPEPARLARWLSGAGIDALTQVVAYDQGNALFAARLWWLLRWLGHSRVAVLDGGFEAWRAAGLPVSAEPARRAPCTFVPGPALEQYLDTAAVERGLAQRSILLVDARAADRFAGRNETLDPVAGHVPGACNHPFALDVDAGGRLLGAAELARRWRATLEDTPVERVVTMCGSGITACHSLLALHHAGLPGARLYAGSWSEWIRDPRRPVTAGP